MKSSSLFASALLLILAACGGGSGGGDSSTTSASSSAGASSSLAASSAAASSVAVSSAAASSAAASSAAAVSSAASSAAVSSAAASSAAASSAAASSAAASSASRLSPANGDSAAYIDTRLKLTFDATPTLGSTGYIKVYKSDGTLVDTIDISTAPVLAGSETQSTLSKANTEIDQLAAAVTSLSNRYRWVYYTPVTISGNTATIKLHDGRLTWGTGYYVTVDSSVFSGNISGSAFTGISSSSAWTFTTKAAPASFTDVTVDDDGAADFRSVQGALNWIMDKCASGTSNGCTTSAKTVTVKNGTYNELLFMRNVSSITIQGESRNGVVVQYENFEHYNPGSGGSATAAATTLTTEISGNRRALGGGRPVFLIEGGDLVKLTNFTLQNTHVKGSYGGVSGLSLNNQAETIYFNSATTTGSRMIATYMNFLSAQDTIQTKGWVWYYQSLITGDVDFIWGGAHAGVFEECELRTIVDTTNSALGGYIVHARTQYGYPGFVILNSQLTSASGVPAGATYLARGPGSTTNVCAASGNTCDNVAFVNTKMGTHITTVGWCSANGGSVACGSNPNPNPATATDTAGWREYLSTDLSGTTLSTVGRDTHSAQISGGGYSASFATRALIFSQWNSNTGWSPVP